MMATLERQTVKLKLTPELTTALWSRAAERGSTLSSAVEVALREALRMPPVALQAVGRPFIKRGEVKS